MCIAAYLQYVLTNPVLFTLFTGMALHSRVAITVFAAVAT